MYRNSKRKLPTFCHVEYASLSPRYGLSVLRPHEKQVYCIPNQKASTKHCTSAENNINVNNNINSTIQKLRYSCGLRRNQIFSTYAYKKI